MNDSLEQRTYDRIKLLHDQIELLQDATKMLLQQVHETKQAQLVMAKAMESLQQAFLQATR